MHQNTNSALTEEPTKQPRHRWCGHGVKAGSRPLLMTQFLSLAVHSLMRGSWSSDHVCSMWGSWCRATLGQFQGTKNGNAAVHVRLQRSFFFFFSFLYCKLQCPLVGYGPHYNKMHWGANWFGYCIWWHVKVLGWTSLILRWGNYWTLFSSYLKRGNLHILVEDGFDTSTSGLWAQRLLLIDINLHG